MSLPTTTVEARLRKLVEEKSNLQLILRLMERLNPLAGLDDMLQEMILAIMDTIGGTNILVYYWVEKELHYADFYTRNKVLAAIDDPLAAQTAKNRDFFEEITNLSQTLLNSSVLPGAFNWSFPLMAGEELIGVVKLENLHISSRSLQGHLPVFFRHASLLLSNEIRSLLRQKSELALKEKTNELDNYFNYAADLFAIASLDGYFLKLNPAWQRVLGYSLSDLQSSKFLDFVHPDDLHATQKAVLRLSQHNAVANFVNRYRHRDGSYRWIEWQSNAVGDLIYAAARDITERKQSEETLARWAHLFEHAEWGIAVGSADAQRIELANPAFASALGYSVEEMLQIPIPALFPPEEQADVAERIRSSTNAGHHTFESVYVRKDGSTFPVWIDVTVVRSEKGEIMYRVVNVQDITKRKKSEAELEQYRHHLEDLVALRTAELAQTRDVAEAANRAKTIFLANMSHELRTPLNVILGFTQLMHKDPNLDESSRKKIQIIDRSGEHLLAMINDILELSKIEAGRTELKEVEFDVLLEAGETVEMIRARAEAKGLDLRLELVPPLCRRMQADLVKLRRILLNMLGNAVKFTEHGQVTLRISTIDQDFPLRPQLEVEVRDTGPGVDPNHLDSVFQPFVQLHNATGQQGTGLGLTISRALARIMGGDISLRSEPGQGSSFCLRIPVLPVELSQEAPPASPELHIEHLEPGQEEFRVLIVEDNPDNASLMEEILENIGFSVRVARNGQVGVELTTQWHPHFIWMDMRMPVMDGYEATRRIRALPQGDKIKIVAVTTSVFKEKEDAILQAGCDGIVHKPFKAETILYETASRLGARFRYGASLVAEREQKRLILHPAKIDGLPTETLDQLKLAAQELHAQGILQMASSLEENHPEIANWLRQRAANYEFASIESLVDSHRKGGAQ